MVEEVGGGDWRRDFIPSHPPILQGDPPFSRALSPHSLHHLEALQSACMFNSEPQLNTVEALRATAMRSNRYGLKFGVFSPISTSILLPEMLNIRSIVRAPIMKPSSSFIRTKNLLISLAHSDDPPIRVSICSLAARVAQSNRRGSPQRCDLRYQH